MAILQLSAGSGTSSKPQISEDCSNGGGCWVSSTFTPYQARVPWHSGARAILSRFFPRYGNYCGPNYSSGRDSGSLLWDKPPIDWLDHCCFVHDIGYDSYNQQDLYNADLAMLECLTRMPIEENPTTPQAIAREAYRQLSIVGLKNVLIPYRKSLLQGQTTHRADELHEEGEKDNGKEP